MGSGRRSSAGRPSRPARPAPSGIHWTFAPMVDVARDPRWGRIVEGAGEDPYLGAAVAAAQVRGFQGRRSAAGARDRRPEALRRRTARPSAGATTTRSTSPTPSCWNVYFPPFAAAIEAGAGNVMTRLHGPERHPRHRQPLAVHRGAARRAGLRGLRRQRRQRGRATWRRTASPPTSRTPRRARWTPVSTWRWRSPTRPTRSLPDAVEKGAVERGGARRRACAACSRRSSGSGLFERPVRRRGRARARCSATPATARWPASPRSARRCCCATRAACCRSTRGRWRSIAVIGPLADSQRDTLGPVGASTTTSTRP